MNWHYLRTFIWLKWRLRSNQMKRAGIGALIIQRLLYVFLLLFALLMFGVLFAVGMSGRLSAPAVMLVWDGVVAGFLLFWMVELLVELQRSELLSLEKFLHLPVSLTGVFLINYIGSLLSPSALVFLAGATGFCIGLVVSEGPLMLLLFPLLAAFILAVTAVTYQFRGWLASLMENKRRRRTIIAFATLGFMLVFQIPNILNFSGFWGPRRNRADSAAAREEARKLEDALAAGEISHDEYTRKTQAVRGKREDQTAFLSEENQRVAAIANMVLPIGWLPYGARASAEGRALPGLLGALGLGLIGAASLRRSYGTTLRLYTGQFSSGVAQPRTPAPPLPTAAGKVKTIPALQSGAALLERRIPWLSESAAAIALAGFRSLTRAPEAKMMLLSPIILLFIFGSMFLRGSTDLSEFMRPLVASGAITMILFTMTQIAGNQFGFDRNGFRTFVLCPASRRDILLGKNLSLLPLALGMGGVMIVVLQYLSPMRVDHFAAALIQMVPMYLVFCIVANFLSIFAPTPIAAGSLRPAKPKGMTILIHLGFFFLFPMALAPTLLPLGAEVGLRWSGWSIPIPVYLVLTVVELAVVAYLYPIVLGLQGRMLQNREQRILEIVTSRTE